LHTFLITAPWFPITITTRGEESFAKVSDAWLLTDRRRTDPKFAPRAPEDVADYLGLDGKTV
jgi:hypothetical protein